MVRVFSSRANDFGRLQQFCGKESNYDNILVWHAKFGHKILWKYYTIKYYRLRFGVRIFNSNSGQFHLVQIFRVSAYHVLQTFGLVSGWFLLVSNWFNSRYYISINIRKIYGNIWFGYGSNFYQKSTNI